MKKYFVLFIIPLLFSCSDATDARQDKRSQLNEADTLLHINIPETVTHVDYLKTYVNDEYQYPYTVYLKIDCSRTITESVIASLGLKPKDKNDNKNCPDWLDDFWEGNFWKMTTFNQRYTISAKEKEEKIDWWKPDTLATNSNYYGYANDTLNKLHLSCNDNWDGRIVLQENDSGFYILADFIH